MAKENPVALKLNQRAIFKELIVGAGSTIFKSNAEGVFLGSTNYSSAPLKMSYAGVFYATSGTIAGNFVVGSSTGESVLINGSAGNISLQYDGAATGTIDGYTTEGAETSYIRIIASGSGRSIKLKDSFIEINGDLRPATDIGYSLGNAGLRWNDVYAKTVVAWGTGSKFSIQGSDGLSAKLKDSTGTEIAEIKGGLIIQKYY